MPSFRRAARAGTAAAWLLAVTGCSLFVSLDDVSGGDAADAGAGGGAEAGATPGPDGATKTPEGGTTPGPGPAFCAAQASALFCADFDDQDIATSFESRTQKNGVVSRVTTAFASGTSSMEATLTPVTATGDEAAAVASHELSAGAVLLAEVKVRIEKRATPSGNDDRFAELLTLEILKNRSSVWQVGIRAHSVSGAPTLELFEYDPISTTTYPLGQAVVVQDAAWQTFRIRVDTAGRTAEVRRMDQDGSPVLANGTINPPSVTFPATWQVNAGLYAPGPQSGWLVHFDDVLVRPP